MNANTQTQQTEARAIQAPTLEAADPTKNLILVSLSRLVSRPTGATCARPAHVHSRTGRIHPACGPAAKPDRHRDH